jgi:adenylate cyclase
MTAPEDLEQAILGEQARLTGTEVSGSAGLELTQATRLWRALGFPEVDHDSPAFTAGDAEALARVATMQRNGDLDFDTIVRMTRAVGQTMDRLAEWEVATLVAALEKELPGSMRDEAMRLVRDVGPDFEQLLTYVWRRHLAAAVARVESLESATEEEQLAQATVGFAELVSFSALTNDLEEDEIGDLVEVFEARAHDVVSRRGGRVVKTLGDSVLYMATSPDEGMDIAWDIIKLIGGDERLPDVHVGVVTGSVVLRMGDVYGPAVNLASRLVGVARRNRVMTDTHTAELLSEERFETRVLPARPVRGFGELEPVAVRRVERG